MRVCAQETLYDKTLNDFVVTQQTYTQWRKVFGIIAATYAGGAIVYSVFGTGELQSWNSGPKSTDKDEAEKEKIPLRNDKV